MADAVDPTQAREPEAQQPEASKPDVRTEPAIPAQPEAHEEPAADALPAVRLRRARLRWPVVVGVVVVVGVLAFGGVTFSKYETATAMTAKAEAAIAEGDYTGGATDARSALTSWSLPAATTALADAKRLEASTAAFQAGQTAMQQGRYRTAIADFGRVAPDDVHASAAVTLRKEAQDQVAIASAVSQFASALAAAVLADGNVTDDYNNAVREPMNSALADFTAYGFLGLGPDTANVDAMRAGVAKVDADTSALATALLRMSAAAGALAQTSLGGSQVQAALQKWQTVQGDVTKLDATLDDVGTEMTDALASGTGQTWSNVQSDIATVNTVLGTLPQDAAAASDASLQFLAYAKAKAPQPKAQTGSQASS